MDVDNNKSNKKAVIRYAGAFIAWVIGSGFATGQELLQFFTSYGYSSYGVVILNLIGFIFISQILFTTGFDKKSDTSFNHFKYFCGEKLGTFYSLLIPVTLILIMSVLLSGAGATLSEYYGINHYIGTAIMAVMVLGAYLIGFERLVKVVSKIGPVIIAFLLLIGMLTIFRDYRNFTEVSNYKAALKVTQSSPHWIISSILYLSLNFLSGSTYFTQLGRTSNSRKDAKYGAIWGAVALILSIAIINTAILLNAENVALLAIPVLYLAGKISYALGAAFTIMLILGMFSSCSAMMWTVCNRFTLGGAKGNRIFAAFITVFIFILGLFSFVELVGIFYPLVGYLGLLFIGCLIYKSINTNYISKYNKEKQSC